MYGVGKVMHLEVINDKLFVNNFKASKIPVVPNLRAIHGTFTYAEITKLNPDIAYYPFVIWLRNPVDFIISTFFLNHSSELRTLNQDEIESKLIEYANKEKYVNRICRHLEGTDIKKIFFIGMIENYTEELYRLSDLMGWNGVKVHKHQSSIEQKIESISNETKSELANINQQDMELYQFVLSLKRTGWWI